MIERPTFLIWQVVTGDYLDFKLGKEVSGVLLQCDSRVYLRDRVLAHISARWTYGGGHFSDRYLSTTFLIWQVPGD